MKGRWISAFFITVALVTTYYAFDGRFFRDLFLFCLAMSIAEIWVVAMLRPYQIWPTACKPYGSWLLELAVLFFAAMFCSGLQKQEIGFIAVTSFLSDTGGIAFGKLFGRHKATLVNGISPKKTVEGYVGTFLSAFLIFVVNLFLFKLEFSTALLIFVIFGGLTAGIGDLLGSATKRQLMIKDSRDVLVTLPVFNVLEYPLKGMGGYLDRLDSISLNILLYVLVMPHH